MDEPIPLARPELGEREEELVIEVLRSGRLSLGPVLERFEQALAAWLEVRDAVGTSSGTAALHLAVRALDWGVGDEIVTSPLSFVASSNCLVYEGATPVFADIDPVTLNINPDAAAAAAGASTKGLLPVHIFGYPAEMAALEELAAERDLPILEDACQALGAVDADGTRVGARGNPAAFAFYANKQLTTGEGGALIPNSEQTADSARSERNQGRAPDMEVIAHDRLGFNYRLSEVAAAIGLAQMERLDELLAKRARAAASYGQRLAALGGAPAGEGDPGGLVLPCADRGPERRSWFVYVVQLPTEVERDAVIGSLAAAGVASKAYLPCIHLTAFYRQRFGFRGGEFPVAERVAERLLALPFFPSISDPQIDRVCEALGKALAERR